MQFLPGLIAGVCAGGTAGARLDHRSAEASIAPLFARTRFAAHA
jgi:hypothetical protein